MPQTSAIAMSRLEQYKTHLAAAFVAMAREQYPRQAPDEAVRKLRRLVNTALKDAQLVLSSASSDDGENAEPFDKNEYMASFMAQKRAWQRRAVELENRRRSLDGRIQLLGQARTEFMDAQWASWQARLGEELEKYLRDNYLLRHTRESAKFVRERFWFEVSAELDTLEVTLSMRCSDA